MYCRNKLFFLLLKYAVLLKKVISHTYIENSSFCLKFKNRKFFKSMKI